MANPQPVQIPLESSGVLEGELVPPGPEGHCLVVFAHGSGSSRRSPRNQQVARRLQSEGLATLLLDLLTPHEEAVDVVSREYRFDIDLLADRLVTTVQWLASQPAMQSCRPAYFGASTGAAAALVAAARQPARIAAVVSRGGRPDLAERLLPEVRAPTLLIVGSADEMVLRLNRRAARRLRCEHRLEVVPGATHLFEEPGGLDHVADVAAAWFTTHCR